MLPFISKLTTKYPKRVLGFWLVLALLALPLTVRIGEVLSTDHGWAPNSEAKAVRQIVDTEFQEQTNYRLLITAEDKGLGLPLEQLRADMAALVQQLEALPLIKRVATAQNQLLVPDFESPTRASLALLELSTEDRSEVAAVTEDIAQLLPSDTSLEFHLTGGSAIEREINMISKRDALRGELIGLSISLIVLIFVFGAVVAATLPLIVAVTAIILALALLFALGQLMPIASFGVTVVSLLGLATGIDYALLMVNRFREELANGLEPTLAAERTVLTAGKAVSVSGLTVLIALSALLIPPLEFIRSMGLSSIVVMLFSVAVSVTALPALFTLLGNRVNALRVTKRQPGTRTRQFWRRRAEQVMRKPLTWAMLGTLFLLILSLPAFRMQVDFLGVRGLTADTSAKQAQEVLASLELEGLQRSIDVLIPLEEKGFFHPSSVRAVSKLTRDVSELERVERVVSATTTEGVPAMLMYQYYASPEGAMASPLAELLSITVSRRGDYALVRVFPTHELSPAQISALINDLKLLAQTYELAPLLGGSYVIDKEWASALYASFPLAVAFVYIATFILLGLAFRSLLIPLKSILLNSLAVGAAFGVITLIFQHGWFISLFGVSQSFGFVETSVPMFIFALVFGLSMDYEVFLVSRIYEGHQRGLTDREAVSYALSVTGNVISSAALIMIIVFTAFIFSSIVLVKTLALGLAVAVLLDATLVRSALVPAFMTLAGRWNWWMPRPFARIAERVNLGHD